MENCMDMYHRCNLNTWQGRIYLFEGPGEFMSIPENTENPLMSVKRQKPLM